MDLLLIALVVLRLIVFALALALTVIGFQAYRTRRSRRLKYAFVGFAFISIGVAFTMLRSFADQFPLLFGIVETLPFIVGFGALCLSLYQ